MDYMAGIKENGLQKPNKNKEDYGWVIMRKII